MLLTSAVALVVFISCGYGIPDGGEETGEDTAKEQSPLVKQLLELVGGDASKEYSAEFKRALELIDARYVDEVDRRELFEAAMEGMLNSLDEHSAYISPEEYRHWQISLDQEFAGIGIEVVLDPETKRLTVLSPLIGSPAYKAGVRAGDAILAIDGTDTEGMTLQNSVKIMRGKAGTTVRVTVLHKGDEKPVEFVIARAVIKIDSVQGDTRNEKGKWNFFLEKNPRVGYIRITSFGQQTRERFRKALKFDDHAVDGLILDLRGNPGGLLTVAVVVCDMFLDEGVIVTVRGRDGRVENEYRARVGKTIVPKDLPVAILVNEYSAGVAEIVAACLKDHGRAVIVGRRTWGKGTVQTLIPLEGGRSRLRLTTADYWRPSEKQLHRKLDATEKDDWGVKPDRGLEVKLTEEEAVKVLQQRRDRDVVRKDVHGIAPPDDGEKPELFDDPQLRKAIEYIESKIGRRDDRPARPD